MQLEFVKMHGLGNDFMIVKWPDDAPVPTRELIARWADRREGVGFDQLLVVDGTEPNHIDARFRIFNADGGEVEQCGNGARCLARFLSGREGAKLALASPGGTLEARILDGEFVEVSYGEPDFRPQALPFEVSEPKERYHLTLSHGEVEFGIASMGNPHAVIEVDSVEDAPVGILGAELATHAAFPQGVNVGFMQRDSRERVRLRVFERGVGETRACGTGAAAAVAVGRQWSELDEEVEVRLPGGTLAVRWPGPGSPLWQTGRTTFVYEGRIEL